MHSDDKKLINITFVVLGLTCPVFFDGWSCWPETPAGSIANQSCPDFISFFEPASKFFHTRINTLLTKHVLLSILLTACNNKDNR